MKERRIEPRLREENLVAVTILSADGAPTLVDKTFFCPTEDISSTGLRLAFREAGVPKGATLALRIAFRKPVRAFKHLGRVIWVRKGNFSGKPFAMGVEFTSLQEGAEETWKRMMASKVEAAQPPADNPVRLRPPPAG